MKKKNNQQNLCEEETFPMNEPLLQLTRRLLHTVVPVSYRDEATGRVKTIRATLIGYHHDFGRPFRYLPRRPFLVVGDMDRHRWTALQVRNIIFNQTPASQPVKPSTEERMEKKDTIIIHCSATYPDQDVTIDDIDRWHRQRGFRCVGYHYFITRDGTIQPGRPYHEEGAHTLGWNRRAIGICYADGYDAGGKEADTRTPRQRDALIRLILQLKKEHPELVHIFGHRDVARKACPCFDAAAEYSELVK